MNENKWKQSKIIDENDIPKLSNFARYMVINTGYYFWDKKVNKIVDKWEIFITFKGIELEDVYFGIHKRYERREK